MQPGAHGLLGPGRLRDRHRDDEVAHLLLGRAFRSRPSSARWSASGLGYILIGRGRGGFNFVILSVGHRHALPGDHRQCRLHRRLHRASRAFRLPRAIHLGGLTLELRLGPRFYYLAAVIFIVVVTRLRRPSTDRGRAARGSPSGMNPRLAESFGVDVFHYRLRRHRGGSRLVGLAGLSTRATSTFVLAHPVRHVAERVHPGATPCSAAWASPCSDRCWAPAVMTVVPQWYSSPTWSRLSSWAWC